MIVFDALRRRARALREHTRAVWFAARDPRMPWAARWLALAVAAYAVSPIDLIPDFIPVLGLLDDLVLLPLGIALVIRLTPPEVIADARERARAVSPPRSVAAAAVIVVLWLAVAGGATVWALRRFGD
jgi:uncharacterized membrane protein YkvA (DUF1232 family)